MRRSQSALRHIVRNAIRRDLLEIHKKIAIVVSRSDPQMRDGMASHFDGGSERRRGVREPLFVVRSHVRIPDTATVSGGPAVSRARSRGIIHLEIILALGEGDGGRVQYAMLLEEKWRRFLVWQWPFGCRVPLLPLGCAHGPVAECRLAHHTVVDSLEPEVIPAQMLCRQVEPVTSTVKPRADDDFLRIVEVVEPERGVAREYVEPTGQMVDGDAGFLDSGGIGKWAAFLEDVLLGYGVDRIAKMQRGEHLKNVAVF